MKFGIGNKEEWYICQKNNNENKLSQMTNTGRNEIQVYYIYGWYLSCHIIGLVYNQLQRKKRSTRLQES